ncbi:MAG: AhpC/TSA family protein [Bacteroidales bacterium]|jgi:thiol-disulfide isomerase/thioredoxin|nr:AhpC/TSA family protein [Bacteroidales bacterium]
MYLFFFVHCKKRYTFAIEFKREKMDRNTIIGLVAGIVMTVVACSSNKNLYIVEGTVPDSTYNGQVVYMTEYENHRRVDSAVVVNGRFIFQGSIDTAAIRRLDLGRRLYANFILESGKITVDMSNPLSAEGTELNKGLAEYTKVLSDDRSQLNSLSESIFSANKNNALGTYVLWEWSDVLTPEKMDSIYGEAGDIVRNYTVIKTILETKKKKKQTAEGMPFIDFTIENGNIDGSKVSFSDYIGKGKYVLVDFWASWCGPCIQETPVIAEVYNKYHGDKFEVLGIAVWDQREATLKSIEEHKMTWSQIIDTQATPTDIYGIDGIPHIILFGPDGTIVARDLRGNTLKAKIAEVLQ